MVKVTISRKEIEKFLADQFKPNYIKWKGDEVEMDIDLDDLKQKPAQIITYPVYVEKTLPRYPYWRYSVTNTGNHSISYCCSQASTTGDTK